MAASMMAMHVKERRGGSGVGLLRCVCVSWAERGSYRGDLRVERIWGEGVRQREEMVTFWRAYLHHNY